MSIPDVTNVTLWFRQFVAITRFEISKSLFSRRAFTAYSLASIPIVLVILSGILPAGSGEPHLGSIERAHRIYAFIYASLILGAVVFLGCAAMFTALFRGEILDRSLHYYLLTPVRREILVIGKYFAGLISAFSLFGATTALSYLLLYLPYGVDQLIADLTDGSLFMQLFNYLGITLLGCMGYGAIFMTTGLLFRNPLLPVAAIAAWELLHFVLPPGLKIFSVIHYLKGLIPIPINEGPIAIIIDAPPLWVSISGITGLSAATLIVAVFFLKRHEVRYTED